jgi:hypothetical protein
MIVKVRRQATESLCRFVGLWAPRPKRESALIRVAKQQRVALLQQPGIKVRLPTFPINTWVRGIFRAQEMRVVGARYDDVRTRGEIVERLRRKSDIRATAVFVHWHSRTTVTVT